jgi:hypothetical protein
MPPVGYNPTMPPVGYNPTMPPVGYNPTMPPMKYNPTRPPMGYNPTMPPMGYDHHDGTVGYNPTMPPMKKGYNPTMPPLDNYNPTRPPKYQPRYFDYSYEYNPTMPPKGYNPTMPPIGYNPTMPPLYNPSFDYNPTRPPGYTPIGGEINPVYNPTTPDCGKKFRGYLLHDEGVLWADSWRGNARNTDQCKILCDASTDCIGFVARRPQTGKMLCDLYKKPEQKKDLRAMTYAKCSKGLKCDEGLGFHGFQFSHAGVWKNGVKILEGKNRYDCSKFCRYDGACIGFTHRITTGGDDECIHYRNLVNKEDRQGMGPHAYTKCSPAQ